MFVAEAGDDGPRARLRWVQTSGGRASGEDTVTVTGGLADGDRVVVSDNVRALSDGERLRIDETLHGSAVSP